ncbi:hypothetical protein ATCC90586_008518 [Pythium insidiosum]|nr:hypothetical protein ATCC90586_008518 [Pythium insidiosum]
MLFGPQYDDEPSGDRVIEPSPTKVKKKKTRSSRPAVPKPASAASSSSSSARMARRTATRPAATDSFDALYSSSFNSPGSNSSAASLSNLYAKTARRRDPLATATQLAATTNRTPPKRVEAGKDDVQCMYPTVWKALQFRKKTIPLASSASVKPVCVTGVDGFLASWIVNELLARGYRVRGTVQSRADDISGILSLPNAHNFTVVETSLLTPEACDAAVQGCDFVIHTGTPSSCSVRDPLSEQQEPGVHSIGSRMHCIIPMMTNFIQACARARVKRVVLTSSIAAMADSVSPNSIINETSWNITSSLERNPHFLSLKLAEEAAWQLVDQLPRDCRIDLVTINFGSATSQKAMIEIDNCSFEVFSILLRFLYTGKVNITPDIAQELLRASSFYHVFELQKRAEAFLAGEIRVENVVDLLTLAEECHATDLKRNCVPFLLRNIHDVVRLPAYASHTKLMKSLEDAQNKRSRSISQRTKSLSVHSNDTDSRKLLSPAYLSPNGNGFSTRSSAFTGTSTIESPPRYRYGVDNGVMMSEVSGPFMKPFGSEEVVLFQRTRELSEDLSDVLSEGVC